MKSNRKEDGNESNDLRTVAFDINDNTPMPLGYVVDELISNQAKAYIRNVKEERKRIKAKKKEKIKDIEYNIFPDNNKQIDDIYSNINISLQYIEVVKNEYYSFKQKIKVYCKGSEEKLNHEMIVKRFKLTIEKYNFLLIPSDSVLEIIGSSITNTNCMKLIKKIHSLLICDSEKNSFNKHYELVMWVYMILGYIEMPLVDDDNSTLYSLNKYLYQSIISKKHNDINTSNTNSESIIIVSMKIVYIIISEIFKQKIMLFNIINK